MKVLGRIASMLLLLFSLAEALPAQNILSDPEHRFTIAVPVGWRVVNSPDHLKLTMGDSVIHILYIPGQTSAAKAGEAALGMTGENYSNVIETEHGQSDLGGDSAIFTNFRGYDDRSVSTLVHVVATSSGWVFFAATSEAGYSSLRDQFKKIEKSFFFTKNIPQAGTPPPASDAPTKAETVPQS